MIAKIAPTLSRPTELTKHFVFHVSRNACQGELKINALSTRIRVLETLRSRFGHLTANGNPQFAVSGFMLSVYPYLGIKIRVW